MCYSFMCLSAHYQSQSRHKSASRKPRGGAWERRRPGPRSISPVDPCPPPAHPVGWVGGGPGTVSRKRRPLKLLSVAILAQVTVQSVCVPL